MSFASKRKRDEGGAEHTKKTRNGELPTQEYTTSDEWPIYAHPEGGIVKITPWGSLRQYTNDNGDHITKFEDVSFEDISFAKPGAAGTTPQDDYMPSTPQSLYNSQQYQQTNHQASYNQSQPTPVRPTIKLSPSDEAEMYVVDGYRGMGPGAVTPPQQQGQFEQEHENYFGMNDHTETEEFDYSDLHQDGDAEMSL
ncbi:uncharacterized protein CANTADRAFT_51884 [Suhomyces tanzawaensis NRRL Y-17324]|uniref:Uncharacterized protein n=1 Tax=Suhomyces tanzawaensis NRRL Y-17324 TaxID=984487 RepID=A0A1E4SJ48_9ASCO|nr:uncharacterized protein CANTADRAFT_51884 [Suhomyces tanzawaensis NRRL Y-17324]ODV79462.1 hypothetical protein CANTADRAFT_51884 [Suhomyces tanzawaensis NRRL Y-17324]